MSSQTYASDCTLRGKDGVIQLTPTGVKLEGVFYSYINGFLLRKEGTIFIDMKKLLSVSCVSSRSKKVLTSFLIVGSILYFVLYLLQKIFSTIFGASGIENILKKIREVEHISNIDMMSDIKSVFVAIVIIGVFSYILFAVYFFSKRRYIEFTFIGGIIRFNSSGIDKQAIDNICRQFYILKR